MNRQIKFRGKRADNGEWVYGSLVNNTNRVIPGSNPAIIFEGSDGRDACEVDADSVGRDKRLRVFYGWAKINKMRKKEAISVIFENDRGRDERTMKFINKMMNVVYVREQTEGEKKGVESAIRMFTEYSVFLADKMFGGSLERALNFNSESDKNNVSESERKEIATKLRQHYLDTHPEYKEPILQMELPFND